MGGFSILAIPNSPSLTRITVFPTNMSAGGGNMSPTSHEVSVAITSLPVVTNTRTTNPAHNVIISEVTPDSVDDVDDTIDFAGPIGGIAAGDGSTSSSSTIGGGAGPLRAAGAFLTRQNSDGAASVQHAILRQTSTENSASTAAAGAQSAPSTLAKVKPEQKTGEVYV